MLPSDILTCSIGNQTVTALHLNGQQIWSATTEEPSSLASYLDIGEFAAKGLTMTVDSLGCITFNGTLQKGTNLYWRINKENLCGVGAYTSLAITDSTIITAGDKEKTLKLNEISGSKTISGTGDFNLLFRTKAACAAYNPLILKIKEGMTQITGTVTEDLSVLCFFLASGLDVSFDNWKIKPTIL